MRIRYVGERFININEPGVHSEVSKRIMPFHKKKFFANIRSARFDNDRQICFSYWRLVALV